MAYSGAVWGIDIGQCGLKALRGRTGEDGTVQAEAFEYIEYPKLLSQQDADRDELIRDAIKTFLSRNSLKGDRVAISVSGQSGLARFIKLPPVDEKQLPDLVGYEAKQQIPFALEDVVWDYQRLPSVEDDDEEFQQTEVGLFAMKRDQVMRLIRPLLDVDIEIDIVQLIPISTLNAVVYDDKLSVADQGESFDSNRWYVIFTMGTETSDLVLTNGARVWQRSIPIGGNHFTQQLTTDLKLTFAKAEHTKRNARESSDPRRVFQSMRPVFNNLVTELQRTLGYFRGLEKKADIQRMVVLGNSLKLPGLSQYLEKNLDLKVDRPEHFRRLRGSTVVDDPTFKDNLLAFPVCYGLVLQGLNQAPMVTNLIPPEIVSQRRVRRKKPWLVAATAAMLAAFAFNYSFHWRAWNSVHMEDWKGVQSKVTDLSQLSSNLKNEDSTRLVELARLEALGKSTVGGADGRLLWLELLKAITASLPVDPAVAESIPSLEEHPLNQRKEIFIDRIETEYFSDVTQWFSGAVEEKYNQMQANRLADQATANPAPDAEGDPAAAAEPAGGEVADASAEPPAATPLEGGAWVIEITGHHFQHSNSSREGAKYVRQNLLDQLESGTIELPDGKGGTETFTVAELGIARPVLIQEKLNGNFQIFNPKSRENLTRTSDTIGGDSMRPGIRKPIGTKEGPKERIQLNEPRFEFTVQFAWKQTPLRDRLEQRIAKQQADPLDVASVSTATNP